MWHYYRIAMRHIEQFSTQEWLLVFLLALAVGAFCMRGFGSRSNY